MKVYYDKKMKYHYGWYFDNVYRINIYLVWPCTDEQQRHFFSKYLDINENYTFDSYASHLPVLLSKGSIYSGSVILLSEWDDIPKCIAALSHECNHLTLALFKHIRTKVISGNSEPFCYYQEFVFRMCLEAINSVKSKRKKR